jgi:hypothetical protein
MLCKIDKRQREGESIPLIPFLTVLELIAEAYALSNHLPFWANKLPHICIPSLDL